MTKDCNCDHSVGENCPDCYAPHFDKADKKLRGKPIEGVFIDELDDSTMSFGVDPAVAGADKHVEFEISPVPDVEIPVHHIDYNAIERRALQSLVEPEERSAAERYARFSSLFAFPIRRPDTLFLEMTDAVHATSDAYRGFYDAVMRNLFLRSVLKMIEDREHHNRPRKVAVRRLRRARGNEARRARRSL